MTTIDQETQTCALCGAEVQCTVLMSQNQFGSPDLDLRPPEMARSSMDLWLQECDSCGYVAPELSTVIENAAETIASQEYQTLRSADSIPPTAKKFRCYATILRSTDVTAAGYANLQAAWVFDDIEDAAAAKESREQAAELLATVKPFADTEHGITGAAIYIDVLRRAESFDDALDEIQSLKSYQTLNEAMTQLLDFEQRLCVAQDPKCYQVQDAIKE